MGHHLVIGRKTYETIGKPLPGRKMIIVTKNSKYHPKDCNVEHSIEDAIKFAERNGEKEVFIIGGGKVFEQSIHKANKIYLTIVHMDANADVFFPKIDKVLWNLIYSQKIDKDEKDEYESDFNIFVRSD